VTDVTADLPQERELTIMERYEALMGPARQPGWKKRDRARADQIYGEHVVDFIGPNMPWGNIGRVAIQTFRLSEPCVYFIGGKIGAVKIGTTIAPLERLATFQLGSPIKLSILALERGDATKEREYHQRFAVHRSHGEWFERCPELMSLIDDLYYATPSPDNDLDAM
jgi:hypothetical protein